MRIIPIIFVLLVLICCFGCGSKSSGPETPSLVTITVAQGAQAPSMTNPQDAIWNSVTSTPFAITGSGNLPTAAGIATLADSVRVQAMVYANTLYLRVKWADDTHDIWYGAYTVTDTHFQVGINDYIVLFDGPDTLLSFEDQLAVLFDGLPNGYWDGLNWRSLTTDSAFLAEGINVSPATQGGAITVTSDSGLEVGESNFLAGSHDPRYIHKDTSLYHGYTLFMNDGLELYNEHYKRSQAWELGQKVPGWVIDSSMVNLSPSVRNSRWDTRAVSSYNAVTGYTVVLARPLNTGFGDDVVLTGSVTTKICIMNNLKSITETNARRGFTPSFILKF